MTEALPHGSYSCSVFTFAFYAVGSFGSVWFVRGVRLLPLLLGANVQIFARNARRRGVHDVDYVRNEFNTDYLVSGWKNATRMIHLSFSRRFLHFLSKNR